MDGWMDGRTDEGSLGQVLPSLCLSFSRYKKAVDVMI
jgi:hypothetical protein